MTKIELERCVKELKKKVSYGVKALRGRRKDGVVETIEFCVNMKNMLIAPIEDLPFLNIENLKFLGGHLINKFFVKYGGAYLGAGDLINPDIVFVDKNGKKFFSFNSYVRNNLADALDKKNSASEVKKSLFSLLSKVVDYYLFLNDIVFERNLELRKRIIDEFKSSEIFEYRVELICKAMLNDDNYFDSVKGFDKFSDFYNEMRGSISVYWMTNFDTDELKKVDLSRLDDERVRRVFRISDEDIEELRKQERVFLTYDRFLFGKMYLNLEYYDGSFKKFRVWETDVYCPWVMISGIRNGVVEFLADVKKKFDEVLEVCDFIVKR